MLCVTGLVAAMATSLYADEPAGVEHVLNLYRQQKYYLAWTEAQRLEFYATPDQARQLRYLADCALFRGGQYVTVSERRRQNVDFGELAGAALLLQAESAWQLGSYKVADACALVATGQSGPAATQARDYRLDLALRRGSPRLASRRATEALTSTDDPDARRLLQLARRAADGTCNYNAAVAGLLSAAVPGAGQAYLERWPAALTSLVAVSAAAAGYWWADREGYRDARRFFLAAGVVFYAGGIYSAAAGAEPARRRDCERIRETLKEQGWRPFDPDAYLAGAGK